MFVWVVKYNGRGCPLLQVVDSIYIYSFVLLLVQVLRIIFLLVGSSLFVAKHDTSLLRGDTLNVFKLHSLKKYL